jgi:hypothetical protein
MFFQTTEHFSDVQNIEFLMVLRTIKNLFGAKLS